MLELKKQSMDGSALVESVFILSVLAIFLTGVPMIGSLIDLKQTAIIASRYSAWEKTVHVDTQHVGADIDNRFFNGVPEKDDATGLNNGVSSLWSRHSKAASIKARNSGSFSAGDIRLTESPIESLSTVGGEQTSGTYSDFSGVLTKAARVIGGKGWKEGNPVSDGLVVSTVRANLDDSTWLDANAFVSESTAIMIDGWSAGHDPEIRSRVQAFVPTSRLEKLGSFISKFKFLPMLGDLKNINNALGCVKTNVVPGKEFLAESESSRLTIYAPNQGDEC